MKVGDYVRTKNGFIGKLNINKDTIAVAKWQGGYDLEERTLYFIDNNRFNEEDIIKSSPNIIDLIEAGDIIKYHPMQNGYAKTNVLFKEIKNGRELVSLHYDITHNKKKILSIITHEQIEQMEYKL